MNGRIAVHLDRGLGWTKPVVVACCRTCGTELARSTKQAAAERAARRRRCPGCGTRAAWRLPGTTSPATDLAVVTGRRTLPPVGAGRLIANPPPVPKCAGRR